MNIVGREVTDGTTKQSTFKKTKLPYDTIELERCRKEFKNRDAEQVGMAVDGAASRCGPTPSRTLLCYHKHHGECSTEPAVWAIALQKFLGPASRKTVHVIWVMKTPCEFLSIHRQSKKAPWKLIYHTWDKIIDFYIKGMLFFWLITCPKFLWKILNIWQTHTLHNLSYNPIVQTLVIRWKLWDLSGISVTWQALFCLI